MISKLVLVSVILLSLVACGGGGSDGGGSSGGNPPNNPIGSVSDSDSAANSVSESAAVGTAVGVILSAVDLDSSDTVAYSLADDAGGLFAVDASTGIVTVASQLDFERAARHVIRGRARSSDGTQSQADFIIDLIDDTQEIVLRTSFPVTDPAAVVHFAGSEIDVSGTISGPPGDTFEVAIEVGTSVVPAVVDVDGRWRAQNVPFNPAGAGLVSLNIVASSQTGRSAATTISISSSGTSSTSVVFSSPQAIAIDPSRGRAIVVDTALATLTAIDLATGRHDILSAPDRGTGPGISLYGRVAVNSAANTAYVWSGGQFISVDLTTGNRTVLSNSSTGTGPLPQGGFGDMAIDSSANRLIVTGLDEMIAIDLATGNRTLVSGNGRGSGPGFGTPGGVAVLSNNQALVTDFDTSVISVDLANGNRTVISSGTVGTGPSLEGSMYLIADEPNNRALVVGPEIDADLIAVSLLNGSRTEVSGNRGTGAHLADPKGIVFDPQSNRVLIVDEIAERVTAIDLGTGDRSILAGNNVGGGVTPFQMSKIDLDFDGGRILSGARNDPFVYSIDLRSGHTSILFNVEDGNGPRAASVTDSVLDLPNNRLLAVSGVGLFGVDLASGDRTLLADADLNNAHSLKSIQDMTLDSAANRVLAVETSDSSDPTVLDIDLSTGLRAPLSGAGLGNGPALAQPRGVILDRTRNRVIVADMATAGVLAVDLTTADRSFISDPVNIFSATAVAIDDASRRLFALNRNFDRTELVEIDELTGARTEISGPDVGDGMAFDRFSDLALDMANNRAFIVNNIGTEILIVDLVSGDRVLFAK